MKNQSNVTETVCKINIFPHVFVIFTSLVQAKIELLLSNVVRVTLANNYNFITVYEIKEIPQHNRNRKKVS